MKRQKHCIRDQLAQLDTAEAAATKTVFARLVALTLPRTVNVDKYLARIGHHGDPKPDLETLRRLQLAHMLAVPFENLSIHYGQPIVLDARALYEKVIERRRGGFCYELNTLFAELLRDIGFDVDLLSAQVATADGGFGPEFDHMALRVALDEPYLVDVGFGDSFRQPLRIAERGEQAQDGISYRIAERGDGLVLTKRLSNKTEAEPEYCFTLRSRELSEYAGMCHHHQTSPTSHFTRKRICSRATPNGRISLSDLRLIVTEGGHREESTLAGEPEFLRALQEHFSIVL